MMFYLPVTPRALPSCFPPSGRAEKSTGGAQPETIPSRRAYYRIPYCTDAERSPPAGGLYPGRQRSQSVDRPGQQRHRDYPAAVARKPLYPIILPLPWNKKITPWETRWKQFFRITPLHLFGLEIPFL